MSIFEIRNSGPTARARWRVLSHIAREGSVVVWTQAGRVVSTSLPHTDLDLLQRLVRQGVLHREGWPVRRRTPEPVRLVFALDAAHRRAVEAVLAGGS